jgi:hypothetical protein
VHAFWLARLFRRSPSGIVRGDEPQVSRGERTGDTGGHVGHLNRVAVAAAGGVNEAWVARYNGPGNSIDEARSIAVDNSGNVYVAGTSYGSETLRDYATIKYDSAGQEQWVARYNGPEKGDDQLNAMVIDGSGNVYVTGWSGINNSYYDCTTIKYNSAGEEQWVVRYNAQTRGYASGEAIAVDGSGNVYVEAFTSNQPNAVFCATIKYNAAGEEQWVAEYHDGGANDDEPAAIAVDGAGNVYVTGRTMNCPDTDYLTLKYNSAGEEQWVARYNGPGKVDDMAAAIAVDDLGNVWVTGDSPGPETTSDYATIKYNSAGQQQWVTRYEQDGDDGARAIAIDASGNVYVTGHIAHPPVGYADYGTIKYNASGQQQWVARYNGPPGDGPDFATAIALDGSGNVYVTGRSSRTNYTYSDNSYATIKYNSVGQEQWVARYDGPGNVDNEAVAIAVDQFGNVFVTGTGGDDYVTIKYGQGPITMSTAPASPIRTATASPTPTAKASEMPSGFGGSPTPTPSTPTPTPICCQYVTSSGTGTIVPGTVDIGNHCDNCLTLVSFPFPVRFYNSAFNQVYINSNGSLLFTGNVAYLRTSCPLPDPCLDAAILAYQDDLRTDGPGDGVFTSISGTAPNRVFNIEWRTTYFGRTGTANFEVRFYENGNSFDIVYGATTDNGSSGESGVQQGSIGRQCDAPTTTFSCHAPTLTNGLKVTYEFSRCPRSRPTPLPRPTLPPRP